MITAAYSYLFLSKCKTVYYKNQVYLQVYYKTAETACHFALSRKLQITVDYISPILHIIGGNLSKLQLLEVPRKIKAQSRRAVDYPYLTHYIWNTVIQKHIPAISESGVITYFSFLLFEIMFIIVFKDR